MQSSPPDWCIYWKLSHLVLVETLTSIWWNRVTSELKPFSFTLSETSPSDCMQERSFFCRIRWVIVRSNIVIGHLLPVPLCSFYSCFHSTLDVFQLVCDIICLWTVIRCFFQSSVIHIAVDAHTHTAYCTCPLNLLFFIKSKRSFLKRFYSVNRFQVNSIHCHRWCFNTQIIENFTLKFFPRSMNCSLKKAGKIAQCCPLSFHPSGT